MTGDFIRTALGEHAEDVAGHDPDLGGLRARIASATRRRRQRLGALVGLVVLLAIAVVSVAALGGDGSAPQPAPQPSPSPSGTRLPFRAEPVEVVPPPDAREQARPIRLLTSLTNDPGVPIVDGVVEVREDQVTEVASCTGSTGTWLVLLIDGSYRTMLPCPGTSHPGGAVGANPFQDPLVEDHITDRVRHRVRMFVTTTEPPNATRAQLVAGIPEATTASLRLEIWGHSPPSVATLVGFEVSALGDGTDRNWFFARGIEAPTAVDSLTVELPASPVDRLVQTVVRYYSYKPGRMPYVEIWLDGHHVDHRFDPPRIAFLDETTAYVPAGGAHIVELRVTRGRAAYADFAAAIFEADDN